MVEVDGPGFLQARECILRQASWLAVASRAHPQAFKTQRARSGLPFSSLFPAQDLTQHCLTPGFSLFLHQMMAVVWAREKLPWASPSAHPHTPLNN